MTLPSPRRLGGPSSWANSTLNYIYQVWSCNSSQAEIQDLLLRVLDHTRDSLPRDAPERRDDPVSFWQWQEQAYSLLLKMAIYILSIPPIPAKWERISSTTELTMGPQRQKTTRRWGRSSACCARRPSRDILIYNSFRTFE